MNLGQFHSRVSGVIKRGASLDTLIPFWVSDAAQLLEQNYTFSWMKRTGIQTVTSGMSACALPPRTKRIEFVRHVLYYDLTSGIMSFSDPLRGVEAKDISGFGSGLPSGFYLDGLTNIQFDSTVVQDETFWVGWAEYTDWPVDLTATPSLLQRGQAVLLAQTLVIFSMEQKDQRMQSMYEGRLEVAIGMLLRAEEELKMQHQNDMVQQYGGFR